MKPIKVACAIIILNKKVLVAQRSSRMTLPLTWEFPGGKIQYEESEIECIHRELKEELNIEVNIVGKMESTFYNYGDFSVILYPYIADFKEGPIVLTEHNAASFYSRDELKNLNWLAADIPILENLLTTDII